MSIVVDPDKILRRLAPRSKVKRLLSGRVSLKRTALGFLDDADFLSKKSVVDVALKTIKGYKKRASDDDDEKKLIKKDPKLLINRVQNEVVLQLHEAVKEKYRGQKARWLPSDADEPRPEHQANYGKVYIIGEGIDGVEPGDEYGCRCGMEILTDDTKLEL